MASTKFLNRDQALKDVIEIAGLRFHQYLQD